MNHDKDKIYVELQLLTNSLPKYDMVIIGLDWNTHIDHGIAVMNSTIDKYDTGVRHWGRFAEEHEFSITNLCILVS